MWNNPINKNRSAKTDLFFWDRFLTFCDSLYCPLRWKQPLELADKHCHRLTLGWWWVSTPLPVACAILNISSVNWDLSNPLALPMGEQIRQKRRAWEGCDAWVFIQIPPLVPSQSCCARQFPQRGSQGDIPITSGLTIWSQMRRNLTLLCDSFWYSACNLSCFVLCCRWCYQYPGRRFPRIFSGVIYFFYPQL